jgi:hypothetical protein
MNEFFPQTTHIPIIDFRKRTGLQLGSMKAVMLGVLLIAAGCQHGQLSALGNLLEGLGAVKQTGALATEPQYRYVHPTLPQAQALQAEYDCQRDMVMAKPGFRQQREPETRTG